MMTTKTADRLAKNDIVYVAGKMYIVLSNRPNMFGERCIELAWTGNRAQAPRTVVVPNLTRYTAVAA